MPHPFDRSPHEAAIAYAAAGFPVFPCRDKRPLVNGGFKSATTDSERISAWWGEWPDALIGIPTGEASGCYVLDLDIDRATGEPTGEASLTAAGLSGVLDDAIEVLTPSGGRHLYFRHDGDLGNTAGRIGDKIDTRGEGGYVCVPGAGGYRWAAGSILDGAPPELPAALRAALVKPKPEPATPQPAAATPLSSMQALAAQLAVPPASIAGANRWAEQAMSAEIGRVMQAGEGTRNDTLNSAAFAIGQIVAGGGLDRGAAEEGLARVGRAVGLDEHEIATTIASGFRSGAREPRTAPERPSQIVQASAPLDPAAAQLAISGRAATLMGRMIRGGSIKPQLDRRYVVKRWLYADTIGVTYGAPGSSKSFFILDMLRHVATGEEWRGNRVRQSPVLYIAGEGAAGIFNRVAAAGGAPDAFVFLPALVDLCANEIDARALVEAFRAAVPDAGDPGVIVIDTLARAMGGGDENSGQDMGRLIRHADMLREATGAHVHLVHHSGKDSDKGARGHSSLLGALDTEIRVTKLDDGTRLATVTKQKDGEDGLRVAYQLASVDLGRDLDDEIVTTCTVEPCEVPSEGEKRAKASPGQSRVLEALRQFTSEHGTPNPGGAGWPEIGARRVVDATHFKEFARDKQHHDTAKERSRAVREALEGMTSKGIVGSNEGHLWIVPKEGTEGT